MAIQEIEGEISDNESFEILDCQAILAEAYRLRDSLASNPADSS